MFMDKVNYACNCTKGACIQDSVWSLSTNNSF